MRLAPLAKDLEITPKTMRWEFASAEAWLDFWERANAPQAVIRAMLPPERYQQLAAVALELVRRIGGNGSSLVLESGWVLVTATSVPITVTWG